jgi:hypothetical protein
MSEDLEASQVIRTASEPGQYQLGTHRLMKTVDDEESKGLR